MTEDKYVSYETARLLNEKRIFFPNCQKCYYQYKEDSDRVVFEDKEGDSGEIDAPTQAAVMRYFREVHNIFIEIELVQYTHEGKMVYSFRIFKNGSWMIVNPTKYYDTYEQTAEDTIQYCLKNLI